MNPFAAIGLTSSIIYFIEFSTKVVSGAVDIYEPASDITDEIRSSEFVSSEIRRLASRLQIQEDAEITAEAKSLCRLAMECGSLAEQIIELADKVKPRDRKSKTSTLWASLMAKRYGGERRRLKSRLNNFRAQLDLQMSYLTRFVARACCDGKGSSQQRQQYRKCIKARVFGFGGKEQLLKTTRTRRKSGSASAENLITGLITLVP